FSELLREFQSAPATAVGTAHGTVVRLERLRTAWGTNEIEALKRSLSRLLPPPPPAELSVPDQPEFSIYIDTPEGPLRHHSGFVSASETLAHPRYRLVGAVDADGDASLAIYAGDEEPVEVVQDNLRTDPWRPSAGPLKLRVRVWGRESRTTEPLLAPDPSARSTTARRGRSPSYRGGSRHRDGFRLQSCGDPWFDWLGFGQRRINA